MKAAYPIVMTQGEKYIVVYIPDFQINTQGNDLTNAMEMARDAIGIMGIDMEDEKEPLPEPSELSVIASENKEAVVTLVDVDFAAYRRANDNRAVKKTLSIPSWLNVEAEKAGVNFSRTLQDALMQQLGISR